jgi:uncharacterized protein YdcH (DUF465 family)
MDIIEEINELVNMVRELEGSRELSLVITNLQQARMWLEEELKKDKY